MRTAELYDIGHLLEQSPLGSAGHQLHLVSSVRLGFTGAASWPGSAGLWRDHAS